MIYPLVREVAEDGIPARDLPHLDVLPPGLLPVAKESRDEA